MRIFLIMYLCSTLSACSSVGAGVETFKVSDLGEQGIPRILESRMNAEAPKALGDEEYIIQPGDKLSIKFFFNPELNENELIVRPDGRISLQLIHEVEAANLTAQQLTSKLAKRYTGQLKNPEIAVIVRSVQKNPSVYVDGEVGSPGTYEIGDSLTVLQVIALASGFNADTARKSEVLVTRRGPDGNSFVITLDINAALSGQDLTQNIPLLPNDFVYIPRSFW